MKPHVMTNIDQLSSDPSKTRTCRLLFRKNFLTVWAVGGAR